MHDYVIVGAGSAGCVLAARLSEDPSTRVLLLEAGGGDDRREIHIPAAFGKLFQTEVDWNYRTEPQPHLAGRSLYWPRGKVLGGSSSMNAQMWVRGNPADYDEWARLGNRGWSYRDTLPYFRRAEDCQEGASEHTGVGGPMGVSALRSPNPLTRVFMKACVQAGIPLNPRINPSAQEGSYYTQVSQRRGERCSTASAYLRPAMKRPNLEVRTQAHATGIVVKQRRAMGVRYVQGGLEKTAEARREVLLCGGAVNSPQLLLLSGIGPAEELAALGIPAVADLPGVGRNLLDHLAVAVIMGARRPITLVSAETPANLLKFLLLRRGMLTSNVAEAHAFLRSAPHLEAPDLELIWAPYPYINHGMTRPTEHGMSIAAVLLRPRSSGRLTLRSADPMAPPVIDPRYLSEPSDLEVLMTGVRRAQEVFRAPALAQEETVPIDPASGTGSDTELTTFIRQKAETLYHPVGTCRMGVEEGAVVDPELRVRGLEGLRVVDASVMPTLIRGHTNAPTIMIAERAADLLRGREPTHHPRGE
ncbi:choline dehydrogenase [Archangium gephyra]|uniref:Choline dehydrogenase n=1 Tax=Archangium gephyra TaxID=48 RepID=A0AAC8THG5_9BACT|nr:GMC family oxidoreductase N-terminal domain-containing protein [Archangium gephyra]AKJ06103.1 Choline dehydrogenase [Archangium gephyra]REG27143.1 choline dehydrogenase [Archangium gephyra]